MTAAMTVMLPACTHSNGTDSRYDSLEAAIADHDSIISAKEQRIASIRNLLPVIDGEARYEVYNKLYNEFYSYDFDSAAHYAHTKYDLALSIGLRREAAFSAIDMARCDIFRGRMLDADRALAIAAADTSVYPDLRLAYGEALIARDRMQPDSDPLPALAAVSNKFDSLSPGWLYNRADILRATGRRREAIEMMMNNAEALDTDIHGRAIAAFIVGRLKLEEGDTLGALDDFTYSAVNDLRSPVRDYSSLYALSGLLFDMGDTERAYRYLNFAAQDHLASKHNANILAAHRLMPTIAAAHDRTTAERDRRQLLLIIGISVLAVALLCALIWIMREYIMAHRAARENRRMADELSALTAEMRAVNAELTESNHTKDAYIAQYLALCSHYIECVEAYRNRLKGIARDKGTNELLYALNSSAVAERELKEFYRNFDSTFLSIYPDFVEHFNALLHPEARLHVEEGSLMPTELRIFALIRLGITDSAQIASFLRRSLSTVYNYRVKMRNAALGSRDDFENKVRNIGK